MGVRLTISTLSNLFGYLISPLPHTKPGMWLIAAPCFTRCKLFTEWRTFGRPAGGGGKKLFFSERPPLFHPLSTSWQHLVTAFHLPTRCTLKGWARLVIHWFKISSPSHRIERKKIIRASWPFGIRRSEWLSNDPGTLRPIHQTFDHRDSNRGPSG